MKTVNDFFCGAGGMGLGFKQAGFEIKGAWDFDEQAIETYKLNVGDHAKLANILEMTHKDVPYADVWTFGAPCQAFSKAGKQLGMTFKCPGCNHEETFEGELIIDRTTFCSVCGNLSKPKDIRGILFFEIMRLLKETKDKPPIIMLENVRGVSKYLDVIEYEYEKRGYKLHKTLYNSKFWGVAQNRERYFVCGVRSDLEKEFEFPIQRETIEVKLKDILEENPDPSLFVNIAEKYSGLIFDGPSDCLIVKQATIKGFDLAYPGDSINIAFPTSKTRRGRKGNQVAQTILTGREQVVVLDDLSIRHYSIRETARLQGFPDEFTFPSEKEAQKQIGNAVTVNVAKAIAEKIKEFLS